MLDEPATIFGRLREEYNECHNEVLSQEELGEKLKEKLEEKFGKEYVNSLRKRLGLSRSTISRIEKGETRPSYELLLGYSIFFNMSIDELIKEVIEAEDNVQLNNLTAGALGLSREAIETLHMISSNSSKAENLMALVNAFLGNKVDTLLFFQQIFSIIGAINPNEMTKTVDCPAGRAGLSDSR